MVKRRERRGVKFLFALQNRDDFLAGGILISSAAYIILIKNGETACIGHIMKGYSFIARRQVHALFNLC